MFLEKRALPVDHMQDEKADSIFQRLWIRVRTAEQVNTCFSREVL